jgi:hypothetical protein
MAKGQANVGKLIGGIIMIVGVVILIGVLFWYYEKNITQAQQVQDYNWADVIGDNVFAKLLTYTISQEPFHLGATNAVSAGIIIIAMWIMIFVSFGNIISDFSSFGKVTSWIIAFCLAVIAANSGVVAGIAAAITGVFIIFGVASVYVGLGAAFVVFIVLNLGISSLGGWLKQRKADIQAAKNEANATVGRGRMKEGVKTLAGVAEATEEAGKP